MWDEVVEHLNPVLEAHPDIRVIRPRLPGHGPQPGPLPDDFEQAARSLEVHAPDIVVGYSLGGRLALGFAAEHPEVAALLVGAHVGLEGESARVARQAWEREQAVRLRELGVDRFMDRWERLPIFATQTAAQREHQRSWRTEHTAAGLAWAMETLGLGRMPVYASHVRGRFITGARDEKFTKVLKALAVSHRIVPEVGHNVVLEAPGVIAEELRTLLGRVYKG